jgi:hypothetical protein
VASATAVIMTLNLRDDFFMTARKRYLTEYGLSLPAFSESNMGLGAAVAYVPVISLARRHLLVMPYAKMALHVH